MSTAEKEEDREQRDITEHARLPARTVYQIVSEEGREQMERPDISLWWSGFAAGLSISFSLLSQAILKHSLPNALWASLVSDFGYSVGFVMVVLAHQQLFTETTITVILPLLADFSRRNARLSTRMWAIVLAANIVGTLFAAAFCTFTPVIAADLRDVMIEISQNAMAFGWWEMLFRGISAGFLIALMVWLLPSAEGSEFYVIVLLTYLISIGGFAHIVAGSVEAFMLLFAGHRGVIETVWDFGVPVLIGNIIGGTALFAMISYAQVMKEI